MQVIILAGGLGTRLKSISDGRPKAMMLVNDRPFIEYQFEQLAEIGLTDILLCIGFGGDMIQEHVGDGSAWGMNVRYSSEDPHALLGTGGALLNALDLMDDVFLALYGDSYLPVNFLDVIEHFKGQDRPYLMSVFKNDGIWDASNTRIEGDRVSFYDKKAVPGEADYIDYGLSGIKKEVILRYKDEPMPLDMARIQSELVASNEMAAYIVTERFYEIGKPEALFEFEAWVREQGK